MIKKLKIVFPATLAIILLMFQYSCADSAEDKRDNYRTFNALLPGEASQIRNGDIIMRQGYGVVSSIILKTLKEDIPVSHIGVISQDSLGDFFVIHSVSRAVSEYDGIQIDELARFVNHSKPNTIIITRYINQKPGLNDFGNLISNRARFYLDNKVPFDHTFNLDDSTAFYCSELVWRIIKDIYYDDVFDSCEDQKFIERLKFSPFYNPDRFETILNQHN